LQFAGESLGAVENLPTSEGFKSQNGFLTGFLGAPPADPFGQPRPLRWLGKAA
jgi:hypothetical protein